MKIFPVGKPQKRISEGLWQRNAHVKRWGKKWPNWKIPKLIVHKKRVKGLVGKETMVLCCRGKKSEEATSAYISFYFSNLYDQINSFNWHKFLFTDYGRKHLEYLRSSYETGPNFGSMLFFFRKKIFWKLPVLFQGRNMQTKTIFKQLFSREYRDKMIPNYKIVEIYIIPKLQWRVLQI